MSKTTVDRKYIENLARHLNCTICSKTLSSPYTAMGCGHTFCRPCIMAHIKNDCRCPDCREPLSIKNLRKNSSFSTIITCIDKMRNLLEDDPIKTRSKISLDTPTLAIAKLKVNSSPSFQTPIRGKSKLNVSKNQMESPPKKSRFTTKKSYIFLTTGLSEDQKSIIASSYNRIGTSKSTLRMDYSRDVTHLISGCNDQILCPRTVKYLRGLLDGLFVVSYDWYLASLSGNRFVEEQPYLIRGDEVVGVTNAVEISLKKHKDGELPIFDNVSFYLAGTFSAPAPSKNDLINLIISGGGKIINRRPKETSSNVLIVIEDLESNMEEEGTVSWMWIFNCISHYKVIK